MDGLICHGFRAIPELNPNCQQHGALLETIAQLSLLSLPMAIKACLLLALQAATTITAQQVPWYIGAPPLGQERSDFVDPERYHVFERPIKHVAVIGAGRESHISTRCCKRLIGAQLMACNSLQSYGKKVYLSAFSNVIRTLEETGTMSRTG